MGGLLALYSIRLLNSLREEGEVQKEKVVLYMQKRLKSRTRHAYEGIVSYKPGVISLATKKRLGDISSRVVKN